jgi:hypothetical protein
VIFGKRAKPSAEPPGLANLLLLGVEELDVVLARPANFVISDEGEQFSIERTGYQS